MTMWIGTESGSQFPQCYMKRCLCVDVESPRGFDAGVMFEDWLDNKYRFVARLVGKRHLLRFSGDMGHNDGHWIPIQARQPAEQTPTPHRFYKLIKRKGKPALHITQIG